MANLDSVIDSYLDQGQQRPASEGSPLSPKPKVEQPNQTPVSQSVTAISASSGAQKPANLDRLIDGYLDKGTPTPSSFTQPTKETPGYIQESLGETKRRVVEGGKTVADAILRPPGAEYRSPLGRVLDVAKGVGELVGAPLAPVGVAAGKGGAYLARDEMKDEALRAKLGNAKALKVRLGSAAGADPEVNSIPHYEALLKLPYEERINRARGGAAQAGEFAAGMLLPGAGITPSLRQLGQAAQAARTTRQAATLGRVIEDLKPLASEGGLATGAPTHRLTIEPSPLRPAGTQQLLNESERIQAGLREAPVSGPLAQRQSVQRTLQAAEDAATGKRPLDLGEIGRRRAAQRAAEAPASQVAPEMRARVSIDPAPEVPRVMQAVDETGRVEAPVTHPVPPPTMRGAEVVPSAEDLISELFPQPRRGPLTPPPTPNSVPDVAPTSGRFDYLRDESGKIELGPMVDAVEGWAKKARKALPQEEFVRRARPDSPVISAIERYEVGMADKLKEAFDVPSLPSKAAQGVKTALGGAKAPAKTWWQEVREMTPDVLNKYEAEAEAAWNAGGRTPEALKAATAKWPKALQEYAEHRATALRGEQAARRYLGLDPIPETPGPYLPRMTDAELRDVGQAGGPLGVGRGLQTTVKGAQHERTFATQLEGEAAGIPYADRRNAILTREVNSLKLRHTAQLVHELETKKAIFRTAEAAKAASPTGQSFALEGLPGSKRWWTATEPERQFIIQNLSEKGGSSLNHYLNAIVRNPNLVNPAPHVIKNMAAKYVLARGPQGLPALARDAAEYLRGANPNLLAEFKRDMPFAESGEPAFTTIARATVREPGIGQTVKGIEDALGLLNKGSARVVFKWGDPSMRYSLYKWYRGQGMSGQEAANHAWIDLIRYGTRSDVTDFWKRIPLNMFVPWRFGTVVSLSKQISRRPVQTALTIGAIDYLRELRYRQSGRWTHMPWDYVEGPIATVIEEGRKGNLAGLTSTALITAAFGPGGEFAAKNLEDWIKGMRAGNSPDYKTLLKVFWGLSQFGDMGKEWHAFMQDGNTSHLTNILTGSLIGERSATQYAPHRLQSNLPETLPGLQKSPKVEAAEAIQEKRQKQNAKRSKAPHRTIDEILEKRGY